MSKIVLLGPQRLAPTLVDAVDRLGIDGPIAIVTAGWQEREEEDEELRTHLDREVVNLRLYHRADEVFARDGELFLAHRARQDRLRELQQLYRFRLDFALEPARRLLARKGSGDLLEAEREAAIEAVRKLDADHLERLRRLHHRYVRDTRPRERPAVAHQREEIAEILSTSAAVAIAGGHVAVLLNRLRLFGLRELLAGKTVFSWSAGAMAISERVVLFHDSPPQGMGNAEVLEVGLAIYRGLVPLPHAQRRLRLGDPARVALFARRFGPAIAVPLDERSHLLWNGRQWLPGEGVRRLETSGEVGSFETLVEAT